MKRDESEDSPLGRLRLAERRAVRVRPGEMVCEGYLQPGRPFPLVLRPAFEGIDLAAWAAANRAEVERRLLAHGALLFRGFGLSSPAGFEQFARAVSPELLDYRERAAPRTEVGRRIYTSTEYPSNQPIALHHEMSYSHNWPTKLWFFCAQPAERGGRTPIACDRQVFGLIDPRIKGRFIEKKVMYVRNYGEGVDLPWQEVFQTTDRARVEEYCRRSGAEFEWCGRDRLRTRQLRQAVATHPVTGDTVWFNHAHMFHQSNLDPLVRRSLLAEFKDDELPRNAFYGDGTPIESSVLDEIRGVYREASVAFDWQRGDVLMLDNFLTSHGREPYAGPRRILVAMAELYTNEEFGAGPREGPPRAAAS
jgi:alpha-ketoglutarate-dependent taurine dioxygenase